MEEKSAAKMSGDMVFLEPPWPHSTPFTTSKVIAECAGIKHHAVRQLIRRYESDFRDFGVLAFEMRKPPVGSGGGRPETLYRLTEQQAAFLLTLLRNTPAVVDFRKELIRQFYAMREELRRLRNAGEQMRPERKSLMKAIQEGLPESPHKDMHYRNYTNLAYMIATGKTAKALRKERGAAADAPVADILTLPETESARLAFMQIAESVRDGMNYQEIRRRLLPSPNGR